jgi:hypothetical protein
MAALAAGSCVFIVIEVVTSLLDASAPPDRISSHDLHSPGAVERDISQQLRCRRAIAVLLQCYS